MIDRTDKSHFTFTQIDNRLLQDKSLTLQAKGLLCYMLSNVDNWHFTLNSLMYFTGAKISQLRSTIAELEQKGYIIKERYYENGKFKRYTYIIRENPQQDDINIYYN